MSITAYNDVRAILMILLLLAGVLLLTRTVLVDTGKWIYRIYKWTDIRYRMILLLAGCIFTSTLAIECFDDAQRIATAGSSFSNWFASGDLPSKLYHFMVLAMTGILPLINFVIFLYRIYHTEKGNPSAGIIAEMIILALVPLAVLVAHYLGRWTIWVVGVSKDNELYDVRSFFKATLFLLSIIYFIYDVFTVRKCFDFGRLDIEAEQSVLEIWNGAGEIQAEFSIKSEMVYKIKKIVYFLRKRIKKDKDF